MPRDLEVRPHLVVSAARWVAPWVGVLCVSTALAYGFTAGISACCPRAATTVVGAPVAAALEVITFGADDPTIEQSGVARSATGVRVVEPPDRKSENRSNAMSTDLQAPSASDLNHGLF